MSLVTEIRKNVADATPVMAMLGATDLAVAKVRRAAAVLPEQAQQRVAALQADVSDVPSKVKSLPELPSRAAEAAHEVLAQLETQYSSLAERGKSLVAQVEDSDAAKALVRQSKATVGRTKAAVTTASHGLDATAESAEQTVAAARLDAADVVAGTKSTKPSRAGIAAKKTAATARRRADLTGAAVKGAATSARKTAAKAEAVIEELGEDLGR